MTVPFGNPIWGPHINKAPVGWTCPVCQKGLAPWMPVCDHKENIKGTKEVNYQWWEERR